MGFFIFIFIVADPQCTGSKKKITLKKYSIKPSIKLEFTYKHGDTKAQIHWNPSWDKPDFKFASTCSHQNGKICGHTMTVTGM